MKTKDKKSDAESDRTEATWIKPAGINSQEVEENHPKAGLLHFSVLIHIWWFIPRDLIQVSNTDVNISAKMSGVRFQDYRFIPTWAFYYARKIPDVHVFTVFKSRKNKNRQEELEPLEKDVFEISKLKINGDFKRTFDQTSSYSWFLSDFYSFRDDVLTFWEPEMSVF